MLILVIAIIAIIAVVGVLFMNNRTDTAVNVDTTGAAVPTTADVREDTLVVPDADTSGTVTVSDILANPDEYANTTVTVEGEIDRVLSPRAFVLDQEGTVAGDEILIITQTPITPPAESADLNPFSETDSVRVTGTVRQLVIAEVEQDFGLDLETEIETEFEDQTMIAASNVTVVENENDQETTEPTDAMMQDEEEVSPTP